MKRAGVLGMLDSLQFKFKTGRLLVFENQVAFFKGQADQKTQRFSSRL